ncbi:biotin--[acetyl-CoA-carboxylase] ligase [Pseudorhodobacter sp. MZDSW-24AT]|uniref:biotin--[acetyl-CoA-carboxylase] ligase n=1 Tax=Pseudorhodobacter sp. MZDSW-24AT TaxID=2052957 RepID=UPI000C1F2CDB|nr:biotin--[acetyl-CoA-carboxylase] ligase [Pseudorhodobacter sp. MZDSW-24AT]PJF08239.1 biotin--[acetyl-CoA-carboxylase] ligase [Pseudorhodobacter sp. MZDSW-24AT]
MGTARWPEGTARVLLPQVDSTNAEAFRRAPQLAGPAWILAAEQSSGRGRRARPWSSPPGNAYATLVMHLQDTPAQIALRSFVAALALHDALSSVMKTPQGLSLKWPNDVLLNGGKVAGILLECQSAGQGRQTLAIGIGVNLIAHPPLSEVEPGATPPVSVLSESGMRVSPEAFLTPLAAAFAAWEARFATEGFAPIRSAWLMQAARLGEPIRARTGTQERHGVFESIDADGNLVLRTPQATLAIPAAEVFF